MAALAAEHVEIAVMRIALQRLLHLDRQAVHAAPHIGVPDRQPYPHTRGNRDHRRASALTTAAARFAGIEPGIRTTIFPANSTSIAGSPPNRRPSAPCAAAPSGAAINSRANPATAACTAWRQRSSWPGEPSAPRPSSQPP